MESRVAIGSWASKFSNVLPFDRLFLRYINNLSLDARLRLPLARRS